MAVSKSVKDVYTVTLDDDPAVHRHIAKILGIKSLPYTDAENLLRNAPKFRPASAFIDINLGFNQCGLDIIPQLKTIWPNTPVIVVTSNPISESVGDALASGADDFIKKPFLSDELLARFNARKRQLSHQRNAEMIDFGDLSFYTILRKLEGPMGEAFLSPIEASLLKYIVASEGAVVSRKELKRICWGSLSISDGALDRHISGLRGALKSVTETVQIRSVYGKGYDLDVITGSKKASHGK